MNSPEELKPGQYEKGKWGGKGKWIKGGRWLWKVAPTGYELDGEGGIREKQPNAMRLDHPLPDIEIPDHTV